MTHRSKKYKSICINNFASHSLCKFMFTPLLIAILYFITSTKNGPLVFIVRVCSFFLIDKKNNNKIHFSNISCKILSILTRPKYIIRRKFTYRNKPSSGKTGRVHINLRTHLFIKKLCNLSVC